MEINAEIKKEVNEDTPDKVKSTRQLRYPFIGYFVISLLVALLTPDYVMSYSWVQWLVGFSERIFPYVSYVGRCSYEPVHFVAAIDSITGTLFWILFLYWGLTGSLRVFIVNWGDKRNNLKKIAMLLPILLIFFVFAWGVYSFIPSSNCNPTSTRQSIMLGSKLGMGTYGAIVFLAGQMFAVGFITSIFICLCLLRIFFFRKQES